MSFSQETASETSPIRYDHHMENSYHYQIIARAIEYIRTHMNDQPSLDQIAKAQHMSASHFQRLFTEWVGVSPKKYLEYLTLAHAKEALLARMGTVETANEIGLSGTGRLYDLVLKWEAVTPGEFARQGEGTVFEWSLINTQFGQAIATMRNGRLAGIEFSNKVGDAQKRWPKAKFVHAPSSLKPVEDALNSMSGEIHLSLLGTDFQIQVWRALLSIPQAQFSSYGTIAQSIGKPNASRAIGTAIGRNPLAVLIPCHRVIRADGHLGGYHWGMERKATLIAYEAAREEVTNR